METLNQQPASKTKRNFIIIASIVSAAIFGAGIGIGYALNKPKSTILNQFFTVRHILGDDFLTLNNPTTPIVFTITQHNVNEWTDFEPEDILNPNDFNLTWSDLITDGAKKTFSKDVSITLSDQTSVGFDSITFSMKKINDMLSIEKIIPVVSTDSKNAKLLTECVVGDDLSGKLICFPGSFRQNSNGASDNYGDCSRIDSEGGKPGSAGMKVLGFGGTVETPDINFTYKAGGNTHEYNSGLNYWDKLIFRVDRSAVPNDTKFNYDLCSTFWYGPSIWNDIPGMIVLSGAVGQDADTFKITKAYDESAFSNVCPSFNKWFKQAYVIDTF